MLVRLTVQGIVQGVGFRFFVQKTALHYGLSGFVKNLQNGDVFIEAIGTQTKLNLFIEEIEVGNRFSDVRNVKIEFDSIEKDFDDFKIAY
ncbi:MAG: acylphosphatase [Calditrichaeota bacterium]|nr:MAG: acylphosphatase [Calditrichota bacterium]